VIRLRCVSKYVRFENDELIHFLSLSCYLSFSYFDFSLFFLILNLVKENNMILQLLQVNHIYYSYNVI